MEQCRESVSDFRKRQASGLYFSSFLIFSSATWLRVGGKEREKKIGDEGRDMFQILIKEICAYILIH